MIIQTILSSTPAAASVSAELVPYDSDYTDLALLNTGNTGVSSVLLASGASSFLAGNTLSSFLGDIALNSAEASLIGYIGAATGCSATLGSSRSPAGTLVLDLIALSMMLLL